MLDSLVLQVRIIYLTSDMSFTLATANRLDSHEVWLESFAA